MFSRFINRSTPAKTDRGPMGFLRGKAKYGQQLSLAQMEWNLGSAIPRVIEIELTPDNQEFLMMAHAPDNSAGLNEFINSLLRQERLRQGFPMKPVSQTPANNLALVPKRPTLAKGWFGGSKHSQP
jgi:hypothetical protein